VYLQEDSIELWQALLRRSATLTPEMLSLLPLLVKLVSEGTDVLPRVLKLLESYLLLDASQILHVRVPLSFVRSRAEPGRQLCCQELFVAFENILGDLPLQAAKAILHALEVIFISAPIEVWAAALESSGTMVKLFDQITKNVSGAFTSISCSRADLGREKQESAVLVCRCTSLCLQKALLRLTRRCRQILPPFRASLWPGRKLSTTSSMLPLFA
jgi:hypothetical protein